MPQNTHPQTGTELRSMFNPALFEQIAESMSHISSAFQPEKFIRSANENLSDLSIMQRLRQTARSLAQALPGAFEHQLNDFYTLAPLLPQGFISIILPEFVALYGKNHFDLSMKALQFFTQFGSSEYAVRHFLMADFERSMAYMREWSTDENEHVRRLASEGCRPRLPWSFQLKNLIEDPSPAWPILDNLKTDPSLYVRKSVANHLNDISKDQPEWLLKKLGSWDQTQPFTAWIVNRALRSLIKAGDSAALALVGVNQSLPIQLLSFDVTPNRNNFV